MRACRAASVVATGVLLAVSAIAACREAASPEVPPVTTASTDGAPPLTAPELAATGGEAGGPRGEEGGTTTARATAPLASPVSAKFVDAPATLEAGDCLRVLVAVVKGKVTAKNETLVAGDVLVLTHGEPFELTGTGTVLWARMDLMPVGCAVLSRPALVKKVVRGGAAPRLEWAGKTMSAHLDVGGAVSPELYLGRLEGSAPVAEHIHAGSWEILAAIEARGTAVVDGTEGRLGAGQIVMIPPGARHAWRPDPGSRLVALQLYSPPGPEQRFVGLAAADRDAGASVNYAAPHDPR